jgi:2-C-methyl-D-erythritol 4-phosphate cytidylyltransferase
MTAAARPVTALVLAAGRGPDEPLARATGTLHKALVPVGGTAMLLRVVAALRAVPRVGLILVAIESEKALAADPALARLLAEGAIAAVPSAASASASVARVLDTRPDALPLLVTTADHALLTPAMVAHLLDHAPGGADLAVPLVRAETVARAWPGARRTYLKFSDGARKGCNLFLMNTPAAARAARFWSTVEADRKRPLRVARHVGLAPLALYVLGLLTLDGAVGRLARRLDLSIATLDMPFPDAAIDVDTPADLASVSAALAARGA